MPWALSRNSCFKQITAAWGINIILLFPYHTHRHLILGILIFVHAFVLTCIMFLFISWVVRGTLVSEQLVLPTGTRLGSTPAYACSACVHDSVLGRLSACFETWACLRRSFRCTVPPAPAILSFISCIYTGDLRGTIRTLIFISLHFTVFACCCCTRHASHCLARDSFWGCWLLIYKHYRGVGLLHSFSIFLAFIHISNCILFCSLSGS